MTDIGNYAFRGCSSLFGITLSLSVTTLGNHVFYGCNTLTIYCESKAAGENWGARWNSGYRPVVYGCVLSSDKSFVQAVEKSAVENYRLVDGEPVNTVTAPVRRGNVCDAPDGTTLYAVWQEKPEPQPDEQEEN